MEPERFPVPGLWSFQMARNVLHPTSPAHLYMAESESRKYCGGDSQPLLLHTSRSMLAFCTDEWRRDTQIGSQTPPDSDQPRQCVRTKSHLGLSLCCHFSSPNPSLLLLLTNSKACSFWMPQETNDFFPAGCWGHVEHL